MIQAVKDSKQQQHRLLNIKKHQEEETLHD